MRHRHQTCKDITTVTAQTEGSTEQKVQTISDATSEKDKNSVVNIKEEEEEDEEESETEVAKVHYKNKRASATSPPTGNAWLKLLFCKNRFT